MRKQDQETINKFEATLAERTAQVDGLRETHEREIWALRNRRQADGQTITNLQQSSARQAAEIQRLLQNHESQIKKLNALSEEKRKTTNHFNRNIEEHANEVAQLNAAHKIQIAQLEDRQTQDQQKIRNFELSIACYTLAIDNQKDYGSQLEELKKRAVEDAGTISKLKQARSDGVAEVEKQFDVVFNELSAK